ncbi:L-amino acid N-acyltransferase YncA [Asanoa ferruginea]|uniref:L-amino acid N-acyltransferase YncA n=1 Tax=Asanoa ferruginea TaxID=53367 RepID=A0A3D9ZPP5_9ACTN|nr:GNAT family N-acetyltransferase [Asanoa ferruginea]REF97923.1 L-amino acid N-acyltransferase YncA [Asanoa ferruginea]GIF50051.1 N-acetyltransferase [Asanoa ferruginea]
MLTIRPQRLEDAAEVAGVHVRAWQAGYAGIIPKDVLDALDPEAFAARRRQWQGAKEFETLVAVDGPAIVGFTTVGRYRNQQNRDDLDPEIGEVLAIYQEPQRLGTGLGRTLMAAGLAELHNRGFRTVRLWVLEDNKRARRFYEKAGFEPDGERNTYDVTSGGETLRLPELRYTRSGGA